MVRTTLFEFTKYPVFLILKTGNKILELMSSLLSRQSSGHCSSIYFHLDAFDSDLTDFGTIGESTFMLFYLMCNSSGMHQGNYLHFWVSGD